MYDVPVWLLDVDGPINARRAGWSATPWRRTVYLETEWKLTWEPRLIQQIRRWVRAGAIDVRWCTTWIPNAGVLEREWALPELPCALTVEQALASPGAVAAAKLEAALDVIAAGRRLIWTDDDAIPRFGPYRARLDAADSLLIAPLGNRGLRPEHVDAIRMFAGLD